MPPGRRKAPEKIFTNRESIYILYKEIFEEAINFDCARLAFPRGARRGPRGAVGRPAQGVELPDHPPFHDQRGERDEPVDQPGEGASPAGVAAKASGGREAEVIRPAPSGPPGGHENILRVGESPSRAGRNTEVSRATRGRRAHPPQRRRRGIAARTAGERRKLRELSLAPAGARDRAARGARRELGHVLFRPERARELFRPRGFFGAPDGALHGARRR